MRTQGISPKLWPSLSISLGIHIGFVLFIIISGYFLSTDVVMMGYGQGGGMGGETSTVGIVDDFSGGAGMIRPSVVPRPPAIDDNDAPKDQSQAIHLPNTIEAKHRQNVPVPGRDEYFLDSALS